MGFQRDIVPLAEVWRQRLHRLLSPWQAYHRGQRPLNKNIFPKRDGAIMLNNLISKLPHKPPILMIDEVISITEEKAVVKSKIKADYYFVWKDSMLSETAHIEIMAQTCAIYLISKNSNVGNSLKINVGLLLAIKNAHFLHTLYVDDEIVISSVLEASIYDYYIFNCDIKKNGQLISKGTVKIYAKL